MKKSNLKLGTRKSLLAWAQSNWVAREVERLNPGVQVELVGIETRGDRILDVSLRNIEGKEFFVAEIDQALTSGAVDFTVHSMKDLSLERPAHLTLGAIPRRENPRDVILFGPQVMDRLKKGTPLKVGTSSPRRLENIPGFLQKALPKLHTDLPQIEFVEIRGNVNTRLSRVHEPVESPKYLDGVVLAFAGLIRLWADTQGANPAQTQLKKLLNNVRWMVLPLPECPAAPAQGALAVECRTGDSAVIEALQKLHHEKSAQQVRSERQILSDWGGGCHQRFGATAFELRGEDFAAEKMLFIRGAKPDGTFVDEVRWAMPPTPPTSGLKPWDGSHFRGEGGRKVLSTNAVQKGSVFVAHWRAATDEQLPVLRESRVWTSGSMSWFKLAEQGIWVEGCAENLGFETLEKTLAESVLELPALNQWQVLTHQQGLAEWDALGVRAIATYQVFPEYSDDAKAQLKSATHVFWSSGSQYLELKNLVAKNGVHACGVGKTQRRLRQDGIEPQTFPSAKEWRKWLKITE